MKCLILLDNGHGEETAGKRSPDGRLMEWSWTRDLAARLMEMLMSRGHEVVLLVPENDDVPLCSGKDNRCKRANKLYAEAQKAGKTAVLVSLHINAKGSDGKWHDARGFNVKVQPGCSEQSKVLARSIYECAENAGLKGNRYVPKEKYWEQNLGILRETAMPAVLGESLFMDNKEDCAYLLSEEGRQTIAEVYFNGIKKFMEVKGYE